jgi:hypothetical protein
MPATRPPLAPALPRAADVLMIGSGYGSQLAWTSEGMWPLYVYSCVCELLIMVILMTHLRMLVVEHDGTAEGHAFQFLSVWTFCVWWTYPVLFLLVRYELISYDVESVCYACLDLLAKGIFGFVLVGSREALEGETSPVALMAMSMIGVKPEHRRTSVDQTAMEEIRSLYHSQSPAGTGAPQLQLDASASGGAAGGAMGPASIDGTESVQQFSSFRATPSQRVAVREGDSTAIYNMNVRGTAGAGGAQALPPTQQGLAAFLAANPSLAAQLAALGQVQAAQAQLAQSSFSPSPAPSPVAALSPGGSLMSTILAQASQTAQ